MEYRLILFSQIHEIVFNGNGGYDWDTVYNMPVWLRLFTFNKLKEHYDKQKQEQERLENQMKNKGKTNEMMKPNITPTQPTYTTKAPKK